jgi:hypothetical protein
MPFLPVALPTYGFPLSVLVIMYTPCWRDSVFFQLCLVVLLNLLKLGVGKADNRFWRPCSLDTVAGGTFSCGQKQPAQNQPLNMPNIANKSRTRTISTGNVPYFTAHLFEFPKNVFNV